MRKLFIALLPALLLTACAGSEDLAPGKTGKKITLSGGTYDQIWNASLASVKSAHGTQALEVEKTLTVTTEDKAAGKIVAGTGMSVLSWGEVVGVWISPAADAPTHTVEVESRTKMQTNVFSNNWEDEIIAGIYKNLGMVAPAPASK